MTTLCSPVSKRSHGQSSLLQIASGKQMRKWLKFWTLLVKSNTEKQKRYWYYFKHFQWIFNISESSEKYQILYSCVLSVKWLRLILKQNHSSALKFPLYYLIWWAGFARLTEFHCLYCGLFVCGFGTRKHRKLFLVILQSFFKVSCYMHVWKYSMF